MHRCTLCNEQIDTVLFELNEAVEIDEEFWHAECYQEYFGEVLETV